MASLAPDPDVVSRRLADEVVLVNLRTNRIFALNRSAARFWELFHAGRPRAEIADALVSEFDVERERVDGEIDGLLASLTAEGLVAAHADG
jgi:hypothetical protein